MLTATGVGAGIGIPMMTAGAGALGADAMNEGAKKAAERAQGFSQQSAQEQMRFQETMSNSAQTRARQDATNAGYNPMLPAINGNSASSPSGAMAQSHKAEVADKVGPSIQSAVGLRKLMNELDGTSSQIALNDALGKKASADGMASVASARAATATAKTLESQQGAVSKEAKARGKKADWDSEAADYDAIMNRAAREAGTATKVMDFVKPLGGGISQYRKYTKQNPKGSMHIDKDGAILRQY